MTLFLRRPVPESKRNDIIYIVDLNNETLHLLPTWVQNTAKFVTHDVKFRRNLTLMTKRRYLHAYNLIHMYSNAKLVITQRIHVALPCVAMGTPVIFINGNKMPGGGGKGNKSSNRVIGLKEMFHLIDLHKMTQNEAKQLLEAFHWDKPPRNPNFGYRMKLITSMWYIIRKKDVFYESALRFGSIPLTPKWMMNDGQQFFIFHLILDSKMNFSGNEYDVMNWYQWRCLESILRYHRTARLYVHSNKLQQSSFNFLTEVGYEITVMKYTIMI